MTEFGDLDTKTKEEIIKLEAEARIKSERFGKPRAQPWPQDKTPKDQQAGSQDERFNPGRGKS